MPFWLTNTLSQKSDSFTYSDEDLETYYEENAASLDSYEYRYCYIYADIPESTTDEDGNTVEPTEEETWPPWTPPLLKPMPW